MGRKTLWRGVEGGEKRQVERESEKERLGRERRGGRVVTGEGKDNEEDE